MRIRIARASESENSVRTRLTELAPARRRPGPGMPRMAPSTESVALQQVMQGRSEPVRGDTAPAQRETTPTHHLMAGAEAMMPSPGLVALQRIMRGHAPLQLAAAPGRRKNPTGLPDALKAGIERLSGVALDGVKVHYDSDKPAQMQACAFTQGTDIHVAPGQEHHLAHEAWHVVQQMQGRVRPTTPQGINDSEDLEREADIMGARALSAALAPSSAPSALHTAPARLPAIAPIQLRNRSNAITSAPFVRPKISLLKKLDFYTTKAWIEIGRSWGLAKKRDEVSQILDSDVHPEHLRAFHQFACQEYSGENVEAHQLIQKIQDTYFMGNFVDLTLLTTLMTQHLASTAPRGLNVPQSKIDSMMPYCRHFQTHPRDCQRSPGTASLHAQFLSALQKLKLDILYNLSDTYARFIFSSFVKQGK